jgi:hypothetical protein
MERTNRRNEVDCESQAVQSTEGSGLLVSFEGGWAALVPPISPLSRLQDQLFWDFLA